MRNSRFKDQETTWVLRHQNRLFAAQTKPADPTLKRYQESEIAQGLINNKALSQLSSPGPYWVEKTKAFFDERWLQSPTQLATNAQFRNWTLLSGPGSPYYAAVDPAGMITPYQQGWSMETWILMDGKLYSPATLDTVTQHQCPETGRVITQFSIGKLDVILRAGFVDHPQVGALVQHTVAVTSKHKTKKQLSICLMIRPVNPLGVSPISDISYLSQQGFVVDKRLGLVLSDQPDNVLCLPISEGPVSPQSQSEMILQASCPNQLASGMAMYNLSFEDGGEASKRVLFPLQEPPLRSNASHQLNSVAQDRLKNRIDLYQRLSHKEIDKLSKDHFIAQKKTLMGFQVPQEDVATFLNQQVRYLAQFCHQDGLVLGPLVYDQSSFLGLVKAAPTLNQIGLKSFVIQLLMAPLKNGAGITFKLLNLRHHFRPLGYWVLAVWDAYLLSKDEQLLVHAWPKVKQLVKRMPGLCHKQGPYQGLLETSLSPDGLKAPDVYLDVNFLAIRVLKIAKKMAKHLGKTEQLISQELLDAELAAAIRRLIKDQAVHLQASAALWLSPTNRDATGILESLSGVYPFKELQPDRELVKSSLALIAAQQDVNGLLLSNGLQPGCSVALNARLAHVYRLRQDVLAHDVFARLSQCALQTGAMPERINPATNGGASGEGHSLAATAEILQLASRFLVNETTSELQLFPAVPVHWIQDGHLGIAQLSTRFGDVSVQAHIQGNRADITLKVLYQSKPKHLAVSWPFVVTKLHIAGQEKAVQTQEITIPVTTTKFSIEWTTSK